MSRFCSSTFTYSQQTGEGGRGHGEHPEGPGPSGRQGPDRVHGSRYSQRVLALADALADLEDRRHAPGPAAAQDGKHQHPGRGPRRRLRPHRHRLPNLVADDQHADPLVSARPCREERAPRQALRGLHHVSPILEGKHQDDPGTRRDARRSSATGHPLRVRRQPGHVDVVVARRSCGTTSRAQRSFGAQAPEAQPQAGLRASRRTTSSTTWPTGRLLGRARGQRGRDRLLRPASGRCASCATTRSFSRSGRRLRGMHATGCAPLPARYRVFGLAWAVSASATASATSSVGRPRRRSSRRGARPRRSRSS